MDSSLCLGWLCILYYLVNFVCLLCILVMQDTSMIAMVVYFVTLRQVHMEFCPIHCGYVRQFEVIVNKCLLLYIHTVITAYDLIVHKKYRS